MGHLSGLGLGNFRTFGAYADENFMDFAPITIITGANNSGKSSIFKALHLLKSSITDGILNEKLNFDGLKHELGNFDRVLNKDFTGSEEEKHFVIALPFYASVKIPLYVYLVFGAKKEMSLKEVLIGEKIDDFIFAWSYKERHYHEDFYDLSCLFKVDTNTIIGKIDYPDSVSSSSGWTVQVPTPESEAERERQLAEFQAWREKFEKKVETNLFEKLASAENDDAKKIELSHFNNTSGNWIWREIFDFKTEINAELSKDQNNYTEKQRTFISRDLAPFLSKDTVHSGSVYSLDNIFEVLKIHNHHAENESQLSKMYDTLLKVLRANFSKSLKRQLKIIEELDFLSASRGRLRNWFVDEQNDSFSKILKEFHEITNGSNKFYEKALQSFIDFWIGDEGFKIGKEIRVNRNDEFGFSRLILKQNDESETSLVDLGFGISQVLPLLIRIVTLAFKNRPKDEEAEFTSSTIIIEEPEGNLHPALQSKLAELFIDASNRFNIQFILETHSEYLIYKLQSYISNKIIKHTDVKIYYLNHPAAVKADTNKKYINPVEIQANGSINLAHFGTGFFDEQTKLKLTLLNIQRDNFFDLFQKTKVQFNVDGVPQEQQFKELIALFDKHFENHDFTTHMNRVRSEFPVHSKFQSDTKKYLAQGYHLMEVYNADGTVGDYAPAVIQFGRAVECEWMNLFIKVKQFITTHYATTYGVWKNKNNYKAQVNTTSFNYTSSRHFREYIAKTGANEFKISFGDIKHIFNLLKDEPEVEIEKVRLLKELNNYLKMSFFNDWSGMKAQFTTINDIVQKRNDAAHTYHSPGLSQSDAVTYKNNVEGLLRTWTNKMR